MSPIIEAIANIIESVTTAKSVAGTPNEEQINQNISLLLEFYWFKEVYRNEPYKELIETNQNVRHVIGISNVKKAQKNSKKQLQIKEKIMETITIEMKNQTI
ncbi:hypothetical protein [Bacillus sp. CECT 9360]|uniref:hypothetical protein n=1 Tax=Bacillus sp. CECT 9360 TaxID=2845821 RepID=UPI001E479EA3|nr:hypothetical protein [Bacillus sp. CECT 9360]CAH0345289.1 hypothetical protein BCI9360_01571 [Bacillus sp. CECT 9360]